MKTFYIFDKEKGERITFDKEIKIGRSSSCDVQVNEKQVSSNHATITIKPDGVYLEDCSSANGTMLNGNRIIAHYPMELTQKDIIQIGDTTFFFNSEEGKDDYVELPSLTGTFQFNSGSLNEIIHEKFAPLSKNDEAGKYSLKNLRKSKDKINSIKLKIAEFEQSKIDRVEFEEYFEQKKKDLEVFDKILEARKFKTVEEIQNAIDSVALINEKIEDEMGIMKKAISEKEEDIKLLQDEINRVLGEINQLKHQYNVDRNELTKNMKIISQYGTDLDEIAERAELVIEVKDLENRLKTFEELDIDLQIEQLKASLLKEEEDLKNIQKTYAKKRFGARSMKMGGGFSKKKAS